MSVIRGSRKAREFPHMTFEGPRHPCFLCGEPVGEGLVIHWMGSGGSANISGMGPVAENMLRQGLISGMADDIYFHPDCVPSFCRRLLEDWERVKGIRPLNVSE